MLELVAPKTLPYFPELQSLHPLISLTPLADEYVPFGHSKQVLLLAAPSSLLYLPLPHGMQTFLSVV
jgi:hypothetical protein